MSYLYYTCHLQCVSLSPRSTNTLSPIGATLSRIVNSMGELPSAYFLVVSYQNERLSWCRSRDTDQEGSALLPIIYLGALYSLSYLFPPLTLISVNMKSFLVRNCILTRYQLFRLCLDFYRCNQPANVIINCCEWTRNALAWFHDCNSRFICARHQDFAYNAHILIFQLYFSGWPPARSSPLRWAWWCTWRWRCKASSVSSVPCPQWCF